MEESLGDVIGKVTQELIYGKLGVDKLEIKYGSWQIKAYKVGNNYRVDVIST